MIERIKDWLVSFAQSSKRRMLSLLKLLFYVLSITSLHLCVWSLSRVIAGTNDEIYQVYLILTMIILGVRLAISRLSRLIPGESSPRREDCVSYVKVTLKWFLICVFLVYLLAFILSYFLCLKHV